MKGRGWRGLSGIWSKHRAFNYFRVLSPSTRSFVYIFHNRLGGREGSFTRNIGIHKLCKEKECRSAIVPTLSYWEEKHTRPLTWRKRQREMREGFKSPTLQLGPVYANPDSFPSKFPDEPATQWYCSN